MDPIDTNPNPGADDAAGAAAAGADGAAAVDAALGAGGDSAGNTDALAAIEAAIAADGDAEDDDGADSASAGAAEGDAAAGAGADGAPAAGEGGKPAGEGADGAATGAEGAQPGKDGKPPADAQPDPEVAAEAKALGLSARAAERFTAMSAEIKTSRPIVEAMSKAGITDVAELPKMVERAKAADDMITMVMETGATSEQYGMTLDYLALVNRGGAGDKDAQAKAWAMHQHEGRELARKFGIDAPGMHDPLSEHADLAGEVASGTLSRERAVEIAQQRRDAVAHHQRQQAEHAHRSGQAAATQAAEAGAQGLRDYDAQMLAADPTYAAKRPALHTMVQFIRQTLPPSQWVAATQSAYATLPTPAAAPPPVAGAGAAAAGRKPPPGAMRPGPSAPGLRPAEFDSPMAAIDAALEG